MSGLIERWKVEKVMETVLLVDGDAASRQAMKFVLELNGYRVIEAEHGLEALQVLGEWADDLRLALCAEELPDMSAKDWTRQMRFLGPEIPTLILTERDRTEIETMPVGPVYGGLPARAPAPARLLEKIRFALDERFFSWRSRASAA